MSLLCSLHYFAKDRALWDLKGPYWSSAKDISKTPSYWEHIVLSVLIFLFFFNLCTFFPPFCLGLYFSTCTFLWRSLSYQGNEDTGDRHGTTQRGVLILRKLAFQPCSSKSYCTQAYTDTQFWTSLSLSCGSFISSFISSLLLTATEKKIKTH